MTSGRWLMGEWVKGEWAKTNRMLPTSEKIKRTLHQGKITLMCIIDRKAK